MGWEAVIGLEIHVQLNTKSKIFSGAATAFGADANTQACAVDLGLPGVLPVLNEQAVRHAIRFGLGVGAQLNTRSIFARKNYFYPDLPKGYQISQYELPIVGSGQLQVQIDETQVKTIGITRAHLEEDAGKSLHEDFSGATGIDLNRAGTPLLEIVSEPDMRSAKEAVAYLKAIHSLVTYLDICDGNMAEGSMRCDANVSVRRIGAEKLGTRAEIKNVNSFRFVEKAINHEIERQINLLESGESIVQETRLYDANKNETRSMRSKEEANDYRYFPDPDLLPVVIEPSLIAQIQSELPELPWDKAKRYQTELGLPAYDASVLTASRELAQYFEQLLTELGTDQAKLAANWVMGELLANLNRTEADIQASPVSASQLAGLLRRIVDNSINGKIAKQVFDILWSEGGEADAIIDSRGLKQVTDSAAIEAIVNQVISDNPKQVAEFQAGNDKVFGFLVGQAMKLSKGKANPQQLNELLRSKLA